MGLIPLAVSKKEDWQITLFFGSLLLLQQILEFSELLVPPAGYLREILNFLKLPLQLPLLSNNTPLIFSCSS